MHRSTTSQVPPSIYPVHPTVSPMPLALFSCQCSAFLSSVINFGCFCLSLRMCIIRSDNNNYLDEYQYLYASKTTGLELIDIAVICKDLLKT